MRMKGCGLELRTRRSTVIACVAMLLLPGIAIAQDTWEDDDTSATASWIGVDGPMQTHDTHDDGDEDWVEFYAFNGDALVIETLNLGTNADTYIELYRGDGTTLITSDDDSGSDSILASYIAWTADAEAFYYVRVISSPFAPTFGANTEYDLDVKYDTGGSAPGTIEVTVVDAGTSEPIEGAQVTLTDFGNKERISNVLGFCDYTIMPAKVYTIRAAATGYGPESEVTVLSGGGTSSVEIRLSLLPVLPVADFSADETAGQAPMDVQFTDLSDPGNGTITDWQWDFGDGNISTDQNPSHTYSDTGVFTVTLEVTNEVGTDEEVKSDLISVSAPPQANFTGTPTFGEAPILTVDFTDQSIPGSSPITSWLWDFGDDTTSSDQDPSHDYMEPGEYTVSLTVTTADGIDTETKEDFVIAAQALPAAKGLSLFILVVVLVLAGGAVLWTSSRRRMDKRN